ncbi:MAG: Do family serine endopeptidase [Nitrospirae bacterium]|nr:Do family serine endopeptidase [Nitrospirota bacterium]
MNVSRAMVLVLMAASLCAATPACEKKAPPELADKTSVDNQKTKPPANGLISAENMFMQVSRDVMPSVVNIRVFQEIDTSKMPDDSYHRGGGGEKKSPHSEQSQGSGVIISEDGYIITNAHVVSDSKDITVKLSDKREFKAKLVGADAKTDIAVLKIESKEPLPKAVLGDSSKLQVGQWAIAIGNPFGLDRTLTVGVVSGMGRADVGITQYENFIQTDASINPGNSGGPLLNSKGEVIGINTAIMSAGQGISFAIPVNNAKEVATSLIEKGKVVRGWLGVGIQPLTPELADGLGLTGNTGVLVNKIYKGSPSEKAGVRVRDVIVMFDGVEITDVHQLQSLVAGTKVGKKAEIKVIRDGGTKSLTAMLDEMSDKKMTEGGKEEQKAELAKALGLTVHPADSTMTGGKYKGVLVVEVAGGSAAEKAGVMPGDVVTSIGKADVQGLDDFRKAAGRLKKGDTAVLMVMRRGTPLFIAFRMEP